MALFPRFCKRSGLRGPERQRVTQLRGLVCVRVERACEPRPAPLLFQVGVAVEHEPGPLPTGFLPVPSVGLARGREPHLGERLELIHLAHAIKAWDPASELLIAGLCRARPRSGAPPPSGLPLAGALLAGAPASASTMPALRRSPWLRAPPSSAPLRAPAPA